MAGALFLDESLQNSIHDDRHIAFMNVGFHGKDPNMSDSADIEVVHDLPGGQFDLSFCGLSCMKSWFTSVVDRLEDDMAARGREPHE